MLFAKNLAVACHLCTCCFSAPVPPSWVVIGHWDSATPLPACFLGFTIKRLAGIWKVREGSSVVSCVFIPPAGSGYYHFILQLLSAFSAPGMLLPSEVPAAGWAILGGESATCIILPTGLSSYWFEHPRFCASSGEIQT